ncbi:4-phosphopantetheinyl transferase [Actinomadura craniellae]|uniref:4-phosphopantetheinyl transferase n=1 Tax=Actinomadura craniellae TaxID=2231787 RepID=A0A365HAI3_9ACTN|nr:4-phosphopantetheinyl transferase [Actinomadura craniellae]
MEPVTVWWASVREAGPAHLALLDEVERARRERYLRDVDRDRFTLGAAVTRLAAGRERGLPPDRVPLTRTCPDCGAPHGRPVIAGGPHISVSHSGDRVAVAVSAHGPVGVDVEAAGRSLAEVAAQLLGPDERVRDAADLLTYWTRKEAVLKVTGDGLRVPLTDVRVSGPGEPPRLLDWAGRPGLAGRITLCALDPGPGHAACLALLDQPAAEVVERPAAELLR